MKNEKAIAKKAVGMHDKQMHGGKKTDLTKLKSGGMAKRYSAGGMPAVQKTKKDEETPSDIADQIQDMRNKKAAEDYEKRKTKANEDAKKGVKTGIFNKAGGAIKMKAGGVTKAKCMAKGGGIEKKGKTKGRMC
jgi:hypothetical protein